MHCTEAKKAELTRLLRSDQYCRACQEREARLTGRSLVRTLELDAVHFKVVQGDQSIVSSHSPFASEQQSA